MRATLEKVPAVPAEQAAIGYINHPTPPMRAAGIKDWSKLDAELVKVANAWSSIPDRCLFYYWARKIRKSVPANTAVKVSDASAIEVLTKVVPRFPLLNTFSDWSAFRSAAGNVAELIADLDEPTRLALACIYWRWGQVSEAIARGRREVKWEKERAEKQNSTVIFTLRPEHMPAINRFRRRFFAGEDLRDDQIAWHFFRAAFLIPDQVHDAVRRLIKYSDAEGLSQDDAIRAMIIAAQGPTKSEGSAA